MKLKRYWPFYLAIIVGIYAIFVDMFWLWISLALVLDGSWLLLHTSPSKKNRQIAQIGTRTIIVLVLIATAAAAFYFWSVSHMSF